MRRLIDADALIDKLLGRVKTPRSTMEILKDVIPLVKEQPTVVEDFVQCKDCCHWVDCPGSTDYVKMCEFAGYMIGGNGYCVYGKEKDDDES